MIRTMLFGVLLGIVVVPWYHIYMALTPTPQSSEGWFFFLAAFLLPVAFYYSWLRRKFPIKKIPGIHQ